MHEINRRTLLGGTAATALGLGLAALPGTAHAAGGRRPTGRVPRGAISIQLYTLRDLLSQDVEGTLRSLAAIGYRKVELAGTYGLTAAQFRRVLDRHGLHATSGHISLAEDMAPMFEDCVTLGHRFAVVPWASFSTADEWKKLADDLNAAGRLARRYGLRFGYHNHSQEFQRLPTGEVPYDIITSRTDPRYVHLELDLYWAVAGGRDPVELIRAHRHRVLQFHVKDRAADGSFADLGTGTIDFPRIFSHSREAGVVEYIVEHDQPTAPLTTAEVGYEYLRAVRFPRR
ncbi:sugar phosphate isomerase [Actinomadura sp. NBRC 104425]|uniref:sugar phosphate isomerase/epimerase family protein n=1 Tax=Actinomadura sp. NBRC 104425 TaxID=3032204 RepID=UPI0024A0689F|nr:sugar phosphate isomerase/epimerase [Actinomadura sp. NBRC 104425]GLZ11788.1 sugar phosphate isomerase [Actinomadura sp. NBRC 104425]